MTLDHAKHIAQGVVHKLMPVTERCKIVGSIRRKVANPTDIDIICIAKRQPIKDLFGFTTGHAISREFIDTINKWERLKGDPQGKYTQRLIDGEKVEISICAPENWANICLIRSGDKDFSHMMVTAALKRGFQQKDGYLWKDDKLIPLFEEEEYFQILNLPFIAPEFRNKDAFKRFNS